MILIKIKIDKRLEYIVYTDLCKLKNKYISKVYVPHQNYPAMFPMNIFGIIATFIFRCGTKIIIDYLYENNLRIFKNIFNSP